MLRSIKRALVSVSKKEALETLAELFKHYHIEVLSTGGTAQTLKSLGVPVTEISDHTGFPEMLDGRVKTLHPKVHGGILAIRENQEHQHSLTEHQIAEIDLVIVNLYPFAETVAKGADFDTCIENIDIGGPSLIRGAAKNHPDVVVLTDPKDYASLQAELAQHQGATSLHFRKQMAAKAYAHTAAYDAVISQWFSAQLEDAFPETMVLAFEKQSSLRYGENPHQNAALYKTHSKIPSVVGAEQLQGKELSYNNLNDADAALELVAEFSKPAVAIIKHANPCGVAVGDTILEAYQKALDSDPVSAFGGIIALNRPLDGPTAEIIHSLFAEVIIAPQIDQEARKILAAKKNLRLLMTNAMPDARRQELTFKSLTGGMLCQTRDDHVFEESALRIVSKRQPTKGELAELQFAYIVCKHVKSNAIVLTKDGGTIGIGAGQMSRVDSVRIACQKANEKMQRSQGAYLASDAFFPFPDGVIEAAKAGIGAIIQPGGSVKDQEVIEAADQYGLLMAFTGMRHFKH